MRFSDKALVVLQSRLKTKSGDTLEDYLKDIHPSRLPEIEEGSPEGRLVRNICFAKVTFMVGEV